MIRRSLFIAPLAVACLFISQAVYASPLNLVGPTHAMFSRSKTVKFSLHNASSASMDLRAGDTVMTLKAGETLAINLPAGTRIVTNVATNDHPAGTLVLQVATGFGGTTVTLH
jgi:hypothetical protein